MAQQINYHPLGYGNEHGEIRFGHIIKNNKYGAYLRSGSDKTHYMNFQSTGNVKQGQKNSTHFYSPGSFTINCGEDIQGTKSADGGKIVNPPAFNLLSPNCLYSISFSSFFITICKKFYLINWGN